MTFPHKYIIQYPSEHEVKVSINKNFVVYETVFAIIAYSIFSCFLLTKTSFDEVTPSEVAFGVISFIFAAHLFRSIKLLLDGETYSFNKHLNTINKNGRTINKLDAIEGIRLIEHIESESANQYELQLDLNDYGLIYFRRTTDLKLKQELGESISQITGIPFSFKTRSEPLLDEEQLEKQKADFQSKVELFEKQYENRSKHELQKIIEEDSPYADYARKAATNILNRINH